MVTIVICYRPGTSEMLDVCLSSLQRHTKQEVACVVATTGVDDGLEGLQEKHMFTVIEVAVSAEPWTRIHGNILDKIIPAEITTEFVLTLDSDCFPIADGWLQNLLDMTTEARLVGILHPWAPPPEGMAKNKLELRIRSQHCWNNTHVACQMLRLADYKELQESCEVNYAGGDDTGLLIPLRAKEKGWKIAGLMPTRCPLPASSYDVREGMDIEQSFNPEHNRTHSVVYGDSVCHVGSYTLMGCGEKKWDSEHFGWAIERMLGESGAEFLLEDRLTHKYRFDEEEEVAERKMNQVLGISPDGRNLRQS